MPKYMLTALFLAAAVLACAQGNYYDAVIDLSGQQLYTALHGLISNNTYNSYDGAKVYLFQQLENHGGFVTCIYTGYEYNVGYNYNGSSDPNTEHTYAQSWFSTPETSIKKADLHHLFPSNSVVNSSRGNLPLFTVYNHNVANVYYSYTPWQSYRGLSQSNIQVFEPADETKGNIARALLYFNTRYYDSLTQQNVDMTPALVQWHFADPPDAAEIARNQGVYAFQYNRNPYVDHPEFVGRIWGGVPANDETAPSAASLRLEKVSPNPFQSSTTIALSSDKSQAARVAIYNARGQLLRSWEQILAPGNTDLNWDGTDARGQKLPVGIYLLRVKADGESVSARIMMR